jgi:hypothetical protein
LTSGDINWSKQAFGLIPGVGSDDFSICINILKELKRNE